jgi:hypothetical protein
MSEIAMFRQFRFFTGLTVRNPALLRLPYMWALPEHVRHDYDARWSV